MTFEELALAPEILQAINEAGYKNPTPIQEKAIPAVLNHQDIFGIAQTGTGKTAAFTLPILHHILTGQKVPTRPYIKALIITPTRELAIQIAENIAIYAKHTKIKHAVIFGGVSQNKQVNDLSRGVDILVATPGRLLDLMNQKIISVKAIDFFVLDEADRMLDMGFIHDIKRLLPFLPKERQSLFFSATRPESIISLSNSILKNPVTVQVNPVSSTAELVAQELYFVSKDNKRKLLFHLLENTNVGSVLIFTRTKHGADRVARDLSKYNVKALAIHGNKSQNARQNALQAFKNGEIKALVATDIAARGIDIDELAYVINYEIPNVPETYVHRIGRTGRAGASGVAVSLCDEEELAYVNDIQKLTKNPIPVVSEHPYHETFRLPQANRGGAPAAKKPENRSNNSRPAGNNSKNNSWRTKRKPSA